MSTYFVPKDARSLKLIVNQRPYLFMAGTPTLVENPRDINYFRQRSDSLVEVKPEGVPVLEQKKTLPLSYNKVVNDKPTQPIPPDAPVRMTKEEVVKKIMVEQKPPYTCLLCGKSGIKNKVTLKTHVGSTKCVPAE
jgi:hypothetical protein